ncbi:Mitochondrial import inner membrane translocase subunit TIM10 [Glycine max]|nr:Mitochondrial import inner membrane translocase subunit TIM10 [Glycine max]
MASNISPSALDKEQIFGMAEKEMEYRVELFNKYKESELNMGENSCIDRCVSKYWHRSSSCNQRSLSYSDKSMSYSILRNKRNKT